MQTQRPKQNRLLAALPDQDYVRLLPFMELVQMPLGMVLHESGDMPRSAYFPTSGVVSLLSGTAHRASVEIAVVGSEGMVNIASLLDGDVRASRAVVRAAGYAFRVKSPVLKNEFARGEGLERLALAYLQALMVQMAQTEACDRVHTAEQRFCRYLLLTLDRSSGHRLTLTKSQMAISLGIAPAAITGLVRHLEADGVLHSAGGRIAILDRSALTQRTCGCYTVVSREYARLFADLAAPPGQARAVENPWGASAGLAASPAW